MSCCQNNINVLFIIGDNHMNIYYNENTRKYNVTEIVLEKKIVWRRFNTFAEAVEYILAQDGRSKPAKMKELA